jgi:hypothetical protein
VAQVRDHLIRGAAANRAPWCVLVAARAVNLNDAHRT